LSKQNRKREAIFRAFVAFLDLQKREMHVLRSLSALYGLLLLNHCVDAQRVPQKRPENVLIIPALLDFQPILLKINVEQDLRRQLNIFCHHHELDLRRCYILEDAINHITDLGAFCKKPERIEPAFVMIKNILLPVVKTKDHISRQAKAEFKWVSDSSENIATDLCHFLQKNKGSQEDDFDCLKSLETAFDVSFKWIENLDICPAISEISHATTGEALAERIHKIEQMIESLSKSSKTSHSSKQPTPPVEEAVEQITPSPIVERKLIPSPPQESKVEKKKEVQLEPVVEEQVKEDAQPLQEVVDKVQVVKEKVVPVVTEEPVAPLLEEEEEKKIKIELTLPELLQQEEMVEEIKEADVIEVEISMKTTMDTDASIIHKGETEELEEDSIVDSFAVLSDQLDTMFASNQTFENIFEDPSNTKPLPTTTSTFVALGTSATVFFLFYVVLDLLWIGISYLRHGHLPIDVDIELEPSSERVLSATSMIQRAWRKRRNSFGCIDRPFVSSSSSSSTSAPLMSPHPLAGTSNVLIRSFYQQRAVMHRLAFRYMRQAKSVAFHAWQVKAHLPTKIAETLDFTGIVGVKAKQLSFSAVAMALRLGNNSSHYHKITSTAFTVSKVTKQLMENSFKTNEQKNEEKKQNEAAKRIQKLWSHYYHLQQQKKHHDKKKKSSYLSKKKNSSLSQSTTANKQQYLFQRNQNELHNWDISAA
jgi:hypothetical protein